VTTAYETKKRELVYEPDRTTSSRLYFQGSFISQNDYPHRIVGRQSTTSRNNSRFRTQKKLDEIARKGELNPVLLNAYEVTRTQDNGAEFETTKHAYVGNRLEARLRHTSGSYNYQYDGPIFAYRNIISPDSAIWPSPPSDLYGSMVAKGTTAIANVIPTNPVANTAQFLGELREGLPTIPGSSAISRGGPGGFADEYVNVEFGLKPIIKDIQDIWTASQSAEKRIAQLERDSGRIIRRRYSFPPELTTGPVEIVADPFPGSPALRTGSTGAYPSVTGKVTRVRTTEVRYWFSGAFSYLYPKGDTTSDKMKRAASNLRATFGLDISPELFWELTPWSWAADWISNFGDVMTNISRFSRDGLVMRWGYVMCTWKCTDTYTLTGQSFNGIGSPTLTQSFTTEVKKRVKATPYGFALDPVDFAPRQWAILAALGISRAQGQLE
jgi:hypothetical protein